MKKSLVFSVSLLFLSLFCHAQDLVPYLGANGKYGFANPDGKVVTQPQFEKAWLPNLQGMLLALDTMHFVRMVRKDGAVLEGGVSHNAVYYLPEVYHATNFKPETGQTDTIPGLYCLRSDQNGPYLLLQEGPGGWTSAPYPGIFYLPPYRLYRDFPNENGGGPFDFYKGLSRVVKAEKRVNFINTELKEIFREDYLNGIIFENGYIGLQAENEAFALADSTGAIKTPFIFSKITPTEQPGCFIVNQAPGNRGVGMINQDGRLLLDTVYAFLEPAGPELLIAGKELNALGLIDYQGHEKLPMTYRSLEYIAGNLFVAARPEWAGQNIIDASGTVQLNQFWSEIKIKQNTRTFPPKVYIQTSDKGKTTLWDDHLQEIYTGARLNVDLTNKKYLWISEEGKNTHLPFGLDGKPLVPAGFETIEELNDIGFMAGKNNLFGLYSYEGKEILPCKYIRIVPEKTGDQYILWARSNPEKTFYTPYTAKGERLPIADQIAPTMQALEIKNCFAPEWVDGQWKLTLPDGTSIYKPKEYPYQNINVGNPDGCLLVEKSSGQCRILNAYFKPIIPTGYNVPEQEYRGPYLKMGLIPVFKGENSGIINTEGEWVQKPGPFRYHILAPNLYSEHRDKVDHINPKGAKIYKTGPKNTLLAEVNYIDDRFTDKGLLPIGRLDGNAPDSLKKYMYYGMGLMKFSLMDTSGRVLFPFMFVEPPRLAGPRWAAKVYTDAYQKKNVVMDNSGKILFDFGTLYSDIGYDNKHNWVYATDKSGLSGIIDTMGNEIMAMQYRNLVWRLEGRFFTTEQVDGVRKLHSASGKEILSGFKYVSAYELPDGYAYCVVDNRCYFLSPDDKILCAAPASRADKLDKYPDLLELETENRKVIYVNYRKGIVYAKER